MIHVQLQPERSAELDVGVATTRLIQAGERVAARSRVTEGFEGVPYVNVDFLTADTAGLWAVLREELRVVPGMAAAAIVCCQGKFGWDDYLLLHHFDTTVPRDELTL